MKTENRKAAVYCRVACADDCAIEEQRESLLRFAAASGFADCAEYIDNGANGLTLDRPAFNRLCGDMQAGNVQVVFIKSVTRIGRNFIGVGEWLCTARELGVEVISEYGDLPDGEPLRSLLASYARRKRHKH